MTPQQLHLVGLAEDADLDHVVVLGAREGSHGLDELGINHR
ncbi:MAG: hypothetical protein SFX73_00550 [Kofleriaceae bacterium]|nr:hypothetical protein [Kofleriaceae bacterium]